MTVSVQKITPCLWFDDQAEAAVQFYVGIFRNAATGRVMRYDAASAEVSGRPEGSVLTVEFRLEGQEFIALNGGPYFKFSEAISFVVNCTTQEEVDYYWDRLGAGGDEKAQQCGWLKDRYGVSWQIVPVVLNELLLDADTAKAQRVMKAMLQMKKLDVTALLRAAGGEGK